MGIRLYKEPKLEKPDLICSWAGVGKIGIIAVDTLRIILRAEKFGEIEPWDFFEPRKVLSKGGLLKDLEFPRNRFYYKRLEKRELIFFIGEEQPTEGGRIYAEGKKAHQMANLVLDVAQKFGCQRVYTAEACVSRTNHQMKPRVCAVVSSENLIQEVKQYQNVVLMSEMDASLPPPRGKGEGVIPGLNGLLLTVAKKRGLEGICLMGEIPDWLSSTPWPYPKASKSVLQVFTDILGIGIDVSFLDKIVDQRYGQRKFMARAEPEPITDEEAKWIGEHIDELFKEGG